MRAVCQSLARRDGALGAAGKRLLARRVWMDDGLPSVAEGFSDFLLARLGRHRAGLSVALAKAVDWELHTYRSGVRVEASFGFEPVSFPEKLPEPHRATPRRGFSESVRAFDVDGPHSMRDLQAYVAGYLGSFVAHDVIANRRTVELHHGSVEDALASLKDRGFTDVHRMRTPRMTFEVFVAAEPGTGSLRYVLADLWGSDRLSHMEKLLRVAKLDRPGGAERVQSEQVRIFDRDGVQEAEAASRLKASFRSSGGPLPSAVVIGFKNGIIGELHRRARGAALLRTLRSELGEDVPSALRERLAQRALREPASLDALAASPQDAFGSSRILAAVEAAQEDLAQLADAHPDLLSAESCALPALPRVFEQAPDDGFIDHGRIRVLCADGARDLLLARNPYGNLSRQVGEVLVAEGVKEIFVVGTAGGLELGAKVGDVHAPSVSVSSDGVATAFENRALQSLETLERRGMAEPVRRNSQVVKVDSTIDETLEEIRRLRAAGHLIVEMELNDLVQATVAEKQARLSAIYLVSDVPGGEQTLEAMSTTHMYRALGAAVDVLVHDLGIQDVELCAP